MLHVFIFQTDSVIQTTLAFYNTLCGSAGAQCAAATAEILADTTCEFSTVICGRTCRAVADTFVNACPANVSLKICKYA